MTEPKLTVRLVGKHTRADGKVRMEWEFKSGQKRIKSAVETGVEDYRSNPGTFERRVLDAIGRDLLEMRALPW